MWKRIEVRPMTSREGTRPRRHGKPGPTGPLPRMARILPKTFGGQIHKDGIRRVLATHDRLEPSTGGLASRNSGDRLIVVGWFISRSRCSEPFAGHRLGVCTSTTRGSLQEHKYHARSE